ncbi:guanylate kinase [Sporanaerobium hydrogeniformans]|uniref:Guanylate kinase n=1 Tax=Sporanaerobium hydrogeniformans TaxID=3072179 RepID=A0AC61DG47_9FIRM|nr:guanylate kinase [Sporanaerobium hydrogeniformans]PHV71798.1 guanylate kinase [Sporanaerobium hydrogeniformans]
MKAEGLKIILSGPSGSGKGTIVRELIKKEHFILSVSATTRLPRQGEQDGVHYFFKTKEEFETMIKDDELLEYAQFCDNYYGTPKTFIEESVKNGKDVILEIEVQGALQVKAIYPEALFVFVMPPTLTELENRLVGRNTETPAVIAQRLARAKEEVAFYKEYDYVVINDSLEEAICDIETIVAAEKLRSSRFKQEIEKVWNA